MKDIKIYKENWWATPIWCFDLNFDDIDFKKIEQECYQEKEKDTLGRAVSNINGWQSNHIDIDKHTEIQKVLQLIQSTSHIFPNELGIKDNYSFIIDNYWININNLNSYNNAHIHPQSLFSCVFYVKTPKNCGNINFIKNQVLQLGIGGYTKNNNSYNYEKVIYEAKEKRAIVFPSHVMHSVEQSKSTEDRISISFNFRTICK